MRRKKRAGPISKIIIGIVTGIVGGLILHFKAVPDYRAANASEAWGQADGVIVESEVLKESRRRKSKLQVYFRPHIVFRYVVRDKDVRASQVYVGGNDISSSSAKDAHEIVSRYPVGERVLVYYNPQNIYQAVLVPGVQRVHYVLLGTLIILTIGGFLFLFSGVSQILSNASRR